MIQLITCEYEKKTREGGKTISEELFAFKNEKEMLQFVKKQFKKNREVHFFGSGYYKTWKEVVKKLNNDIYDYDQFCFFGKNTRTFTETFSIKRLQYREQQDLKPRHKIGDTINYIYNRHEVSIRWSQKGLFFISVTSPTHGRVGSSESEHDIKKVRRKIRKEINKEIENYSEEEHIQFMLGLKKKR